jgi:hypothetical protein
LTPDVLLPLLGFVCGTLIVAVGVALRERRRSLRLAGEVERLRDETALLERRDDDTGLWNSRHFVETLTREIERARTYERPVALALASVDDVTPSEVEQAMRSLGQAIGGSVRSIDVACRVGSTELGVGRVGACPARDRPGAHRGRLEAAGRRRHRRVPGSRRDVRRADRAGRIRTAERAPRCPRRAAPAGDGPGRDGRLGRRGVASIHPG